MDARIDWSTARRPDGEVTQEHPAAFDEGLQEEMWRVSAELTQD